jgi:hypothetical protein
LRSDETGSASDEYLHELPPVLCVTWWVW